MKNDTHVYEEKKIGHYTVKVIQDEYPEDPRKAWDNLCTMICFHSRYNLGDKHNMSIDEAKDFLKREDIFYLPLYLYDHSGITMSTGSFSDPWDSGQVGFIYVEKSKVREEWKVKKISKKLKETIFRNLKAEVKTYDNYLMGSVYGFIVEDENGEFVDSCFGFYGETDYCLKEGISAAEYLIKQEMHNHLQKLKRQIKNHVPLIYREACPVKK